MKKKLKFIRFLPLILLISLVSFFFVQSQFFSTGKATETAIETSKTTSYIYAGGLVSSYDSNGEEKFYVNDHLGGTSVVLNSSGSKIGEEKYYAFGEEKTQSGEKFTYTGKEKDDSGLYYYGARYYDAVTGRFLQADPLSGSAGNPQSMNRYVYVMNNPMGYVDPSGMSEFAVGGVEPLGEIDYNWGKIPSPGTYFAEYFDPIYISAARVGIDPYSFAGALFKEGFAVELNYAKEYGWYFDPSWTGDPETEKLPPLPREDLLGSTGKMGLEWFGASMEILKKGGYLDKNYGGYEVFGDLFDHYYQKRVPKGAGVFHSLSSQLEAFAAMYSYNRDMFLSDYRGAGGDASLLSGNVVDTWSYMYFNLGPNDHKNKNGNLVKGARNRLKDSIKSGKLIKDNPKKGTPEWNSQRAAATGNSLRE